MIKISEVTKKFGSQVVLDNVSLNMRQGEKLLIAGQNGAGKTTLMRIILGEYRSDKGSVRIADFDPLKERGKALSKIAFVPQTPPPLKLTLEELAYYVSRSCGIDSQQIWNMAESMELEWKKNLKKTFFKLSGGMKQKLLIAIALSRDSDILMFDEPTANLDPSARKNFDALIRNVAKDKTLIFISHRIQEVEGIVTRMVEMDLGKVVKDEKI
ncbi:MAG: ABC transporter ATP-binding protein [Wolinella sp.]